MGETGISFALGVGRSGTTLLGRILALTATPARFVNELCPGIPERIPNPVFMVEPGDEATQRRVCGAVEELAHGKCPFSERQAVRIERDDADARQLIVKDVHSLLAWPEIAGGLRGWKAVVITRDTARAVDSYLHGHRPGERRYLVEEFAYLARHLGDAPPGSRLARAADAAGPRVARYLRRPRPFTREVLRQAAVSEVLACFLRAWAEDDERVTHVSFEELCRDPLGQAVRLYDFLGLDHDERTLARVRETTSGSSDAYYATDKDSRAVLQRPHRALRPADARRVARLLGGA
ncbi:MAG: hypothetical protein ACQGVC_25245 [Myxococcota bacterium]